MQDARMQASNVYAAHFFFFSLLKSAIYIYIYIVYSWMNGVANTSCWTEENIIIACFTIHGVFVSIDAEMRASARKNSRWLAGWRLQVARLPPLISFSTFWCGAAAIATDRHGMHTSTTSVAVQMCAYMWNRISKNVYAISQLHPQSQPSI